MSEQQQIQIRGLLESGLAVQQRERLASLKSLAAMRKEASDEIQRLLDFLDASDPYVMTELEQNDDDLPQLEADEEHSLGSVEQINQNRWDAGCSSDGDLELDDCDDEPSLGAPEDHPNGFRDASDFGCGRSQERWARGGFDDREADDSDAEPSLCGIQVEPGDDRDLEDDNDSGIGDRDALRSESARPGTKFSPAS